MTRACRAVIDHAFRELALNRLEIRCGAENLRSQAIAQRLGFTREGTLRQAMCLNQHLIDQVVFGLLASEWPLSA
ncbi:putative ribosomal N-acetyltransferase YdaF [compost metagenome]